MKAADIMYRPVMAASPTANARDVAVQLLAGFFSGMPVADADGTVLGVVTEIDLIRALRQGRALEGTTAREIMSAPARTVDVETPVEEVMQILDADEIIRVPVTDHGKLVGIISRVDILKAMIRPEFSEFSPESGV